MGMLYKNNLDRWDCPFQETNLSQQIAFWDAGRAYAQQGELIHLSQAPDKNGGKPFWAEFVKIWIQQVFNVNVEENSKKEKKMPII